MSVTNPESFMLPGGFGGYAAIELALQIDGTPNIEKLMAFGFPAPLAVELQRQMLAGAGSVPDLMGLGVPPMVAEAIKAAIDA